jgi:DNA-binding response OmpR family regulator
LKLLNRYNIALFIEDKAQDILYKKFGKMGVNVSKIDNSQSLLDTSLVIIDLNYPLERGYTMIDAINQNPKLSHLSIIVLITSAEDFKKLSVLQNLRVVDYLSKNIVFSELIGKIKTLFNQNQVSSIDVDCDVELGVKVRMTHLSESGAMLSSGILFEKKAKVDINSKLLNTILGKQKPIYKVMQSGPGYSNDFSTTLSFSNLDEVHRRRIRKIFHAWQVK